MAAATAADVHHRMPDGKKWYQVPGIRYFEVLSLTPEKKAKMYFIEGRF